MRPLASLTSSNPSEEALQKEVEDLAQSTRRQMYVMVFTGFFLAITLSVPDYELARADAEIHWPLIQTQVRLRSFLTYAPIALTALMIYLHLFVERMEEVRRFGVQPAQTFIFTMQSTPARWVADAVLYAYVPAILLWFLWKVCFRPEAIYLASLTGIVLCGSAYVYYRRSQVSRHMAHRIFSKLAVISIVGLTLLSAMYLSIAGSDAVLRLRQLNLEQSNLGITDDLGYVDLKNMNLAFANIRKARLSGADLLEADLREAQMQFAVLGTNAPDEKPARITDLSGADMERAALHGASILNVSLVEAKMSGAKLHQAELAQADFRSADLRESEFIKAILVSGELIFQCADLSGAQLSNAKLDGTNFIRSRLNNAELDGGDFHGSNFNWANLAGADLNNANLANATFLKADLTGAILTDAFLENVDFLQANLTNANLKKARAVDEVQLSRAHLCNTQVSNGDIRNDHCHLEWSHAGNSTSCSGRPN